MGGPIPAPDASGPFAEGLAKRSYAGERFTGEVLLDGGVFERCTFVKASLRYAGGAPPVLQDCVFESVSFEFVGAAGRTLTFLKAISSPRSGLSDVFKASFPYRYGH